MSTEPVNPYAPPTSNPIPEIQNLEFRPLATLGERFVGSLIDGLISIPPTIMIFTILHFMGAFSSIDEIEQLGYGYSVMVTIAGLAFFAMIHGVLLSSNGQTIGKKIMKTKIVRMDQTKPGMPELIGKRYGFMYLISLVPGVGTAISLISILFIFRSDRRCLHDLVAGTQVVKV